jgi:HlyD family secretion protein
MKKLVVSLVGLAVVAGGGYGYYRYTSKPSAPVVSAATVTRGDVVESVGATGTLQAVTTVQVGSQVSGNISFLGADFNSLVKKDQVLARLDPALFQAQLEQSQANLVQARANVIKAQGDLEQRKVALIDAQQKYTRAKELAARSLIPQSDLDAAKIAVDSADAAVQSQIATVNQSQAAITQAQATVNQNQVNLDHTVITAPIDGLVISRSVDVGQTVAASMQAPTLFILAADLTKMQVVANLDESDVGRIRPNQTVTFRVDAYPGDTFRGKVSQVRLQSVVQQNVVTYGTVIDVANDDLRLKPGMTANVNVEISRANNVVRVPNSALRFRPSNEVYAALGQTPPEPQGRGSGGGRRGAGNAPAGASAPMSAPGAAAPPSSSDAQREADGRAAGGRGAAPSGAPAPGAAPPVPPGGGEGSVPQSNDSTAQGAGPARRGNRDAATVGGDQTGIDRRSRSSGTGRANTPPASAPGAAGGASTIDALFAPLPHTQSVGRAFMYVDKQLKPLRLRLGISDGQTTELIEGDLKEGDSVVTNVVLPGQSTTRPAANAFPGFGPQRGFGPGPGGGGRGR